MSNGFGPILIAALLLREGGICAMHGSLLGCRRHATTGNHRLNRKAGGSKLRNGMSNGCAICDFCNDAIESNSLARRIAIVLGVKLEEGDTPAECPMWHPFLCQMVQPGDYALVLLGDPKPDIEGIV